MNILVLNCTVSCLMLETVVIVNACFHPIYLLAIFKYYILFVINGIVLFVLYLEFYFYILYSNFILLDINYFALLIILRIYLLLF